MAALLQRQFVFLSIVTALLFVISGFMALGSNRSMLSSSTVQQATARISSLALLSFVSREIPALSSTIQPESSQTDESFSELVFSMVTGINPGDLRSLMGRELPGLLTFDDARIVVPGVGTDLSDLYIESASPHDVAPEGGSTAGVTEEPPAADEQGTAKEGIETPPAPQPDANMAKKKTVFIYHTHNRESWLNETKMNPTTEAVDHPTRNITLVGKKLAEELQGKGIGTVVNTDDIYSRAPYSLAYAESLKEVKAAVSENRDMQYFFDLHRDMQPREKTTVNIGGKNYARVFFVIGLRNKNYEKNTEFAKELHHLLEKKYPGISRGVTEKGTKNGNGEYNQSISPGSLLIEIGGTGNTLQESYNTAAALADVFAEYYWKAERVSQEQPVKTDKR
ncbi:stage II sporulation protein P [Brevibacillus migulae]|uniref:stage II sporulation protein P n=1 Tax=Brevibacillus migulae TaxID=1644114 RepID=UPI00106E057B|nr:stage II sporulation protein P [Brevibacillus migulae]